MSSQRYFIHLAFEGTFFHGWQRQPNGKTVQEEVEAAISLILREPVVLTGAGRTDTGVHARSFYAHFDSPSILTATDRNLLVYKLNSYLVSSIVIFEIFPVKQSLHARFSAISRTYSYHISATKDPFRRFYQHHLHLPLDLKLMNQGADLIMKYDDFTSFSKVDTDTKTNICRISSAGWEEKEGEIVFMITADRFLRNMVRAIAGTLVDLGLEKITLEDLQFILDSRNRSNAGNSLPGKGLFLRNIKYPEGFRDL